MSSFPWHKHKYLPIVYNKHYKCLCSSLLGCMSQMSYLYARKPLNVSIYIYFILFFSPTIELQKCTYIYLFVRIEFFCIHVNSQMYIYRYTYLFIIVFVSVSLYAWLSEPVCLPTIHPSQSKHVTCLPDERRWLCLYLPPKCQQSTPLQFHCLSGLFLMRETKGLFWGEMQIHCLFFWTLKRHEVF